MEREEGGSGDGEVLPEEGIEPACGKPAVPVMERKNHVRPPVPIMGTSGFDWTVAVRGSRRDLCCQLPPADLLNRERNLMQT